MFDVSKECMQNFSGDLGHITPRGPIFYGLNTARNNSCFGGMKRGSQV